MRNKEQIENGHWDLENSRIVRVELTFIAIQVIAMWWWSKKNDLKSRFEIVENEVKLERWRSNCENLFIIFFASNFCNNYFAILQKRSEIAIEWHKFHNICFIDVVVVVEVEIIYVWSCIDIVYLNLKLKNITR